MSKQEKVFTPKKGILKKYAEVMVNFGCGSGKGIKKGDVVNVVGKEVAKPLLMEIIESITDAGGYPILTYLPNEGVGVASKYFVEHADKKMLGFQPSAMYDGLIKQIDHEIFVISSTDKKYFKNVDPERLMLFKSAISKAYRMGPRMEKVNQGKLHWTLCIYGTEAMAKEVNMTPKDYWKEIENACLLHEKDPVKAWKETNAELQRVKKKLTALKIEKIHIEGKTVDLWIKLGADRQWVTGDGANIPSFEIFATPDWRGTEGWIKFSEPLYYGGQVITGIELEFKKGLVVSVKAKKGKKILEEMIKQKNANKVGEFSLTDKRTSKITKPMGETLFDENMGGKFGNTHIALGMGYKDGIKNYRKLTKKEFEKTGVNESTVHTDIISTDDRVATAILANGKEKIIYKDGMFTV